MGIVRVFKDAVSGRDQAEREAIKAAMQPVGCGSCGRTYGSRSAHAVAHDGGRCLPDHVTEGLLVERSGVFCIPGSDAARG